MYRIAKPVAKSFQRERRKLALATRVGVAARVVQPQICRIAAAFGPRFWLLLEIFPCSGQRGSLVAALKFGDAIRPNHQEALLVIRAAVEHQ